MAVLPITPAQVQQQVLEAIPDQVIEAVNTLIVKNWSQNYACVTQKAIVLLSCQLMGLEDNQFDYNWLDFEDLYRNEGWYVLFDKAHYSDNYDSFFKFTKK